MADEERIKAPGYMMYREAALMFSLMPEMDAAIAIKAVVNYFLYDAIPENIGGIAEQVFDIMRDDINKNNEKYEKIVKRNRENSPKGPRKKKET